MIDVVYVSIKVVMPLIVNLLSKTFVSMLMHSRYATNPYKLYISLLEKNKQRMIANQQNDVGEFNTILLENLREATLQILEKNNL